MPKMSDYKGE